ncbi:uncharacterized protein E0L32_006926 [Thyridium curvatum]|uniref:Uncharacterized protein n=1 Tax=Thyridium curvatum TaxID=1093900 RepID=A0A507B4L1_9PEZI|nr:uncharacterized protein E0L32_006926 [Thyridium curvatum]TPX12279.1 hypothetical protein E0L32_006926 [Thyridium curvatum]
MLPNATENNPAGRALTNGICSCERRRAGVLQIPSLSLTPKDSFLRGQADSAVNGEFEQESGNAQGPERIGIELDAGRLITRLSIPRSSITHIAGSFSRPKSTRSFATRAWSTPPPPPPASSESKATPWILAPASGASSL